MCCRMGCLNGPNNKPTLASADSYLHVELMTVVEGLLKVAVVEISTLVDRWKDNNNQNQDRTVKGQTADYGADSFSISRDSFEECGTS